MPDERGHLKVFIGMAPGVGKTYRMLQEGAAEADNGRDVAIGYLEPGRAETAAQAEGLEIVSRRRVLYRGTPLEEMDLPAVLARRPELCLIDELAHTNAPGVEHEKRYEPGAGAEADRAPRRRRAARPGGARPPGDRRAAARAGDARAAFRARRAARVALGPAP
jgi:Osmosensitive K+ channel His kinase sensor domain